MIISRYYHDNIKHISETREAAPPLTSQKKKFKFYTTNLIC